MSIHVFGSSNGNSILRRLHGRIHIVFSIRSLLYEYFNRLLTALRRRVAGHFLSTTRPRLVGEGFAGVPSRLSSLLGGETRDRG
jgi:hypothetical protein